MSDYALVSQGKSLKDQDNVEGMMMQNVMSLGLMNGLSDIPEVLKVQLIFPSSQSEVLTYCFGIHSSGTLSSLSLGPNLRYVSYHQYFDILCRY